MIVYRECIWGPMDGLKVMVSHDVEIVGFPMDGRNGDELCWYQIDGVFLRFHGYESPDGKADSFVE